VANSSNLLVTLPAKDYNPVSGISQGTHSLRGHTQRLALGFAGYQFLALYGQAPAFQFPGQGFLVDAFQQAGLCVPGYDRFW
jgi:hypothetical protein